MGGFSGQSQSQWHTLCLKKKKQKCFWYCQHFPGSRFYCQFLMVSGVHWPCWCEGWAWGACPSLWCGPICTWRHRVSASTPSSAWITWSTHTAERSTEKWSAAKGTGDSCHKGRWELIDYQWTVYLEFNQSTYISHNILKNIFKTHSYYQWHCNGSKEL